MPPPSRTAALLSQGYRFAGGVFSFQMSGGISMPALAHPHPARRLCALMLLSAFPLACSTWSVQPTTPRDLIATQHPKSVRVTRMDHTRLVIVEPEISADTMYGFAERGLRLGRGARPSDGTRSRTGIPLSDVREIAVRRTDWAKTGFAGAAVAGVAALVITMAALQGEE